MAINHADFGIAATFPLKAERTTVYVVSCWFMNVHEWRNVYPKPAVIAQKGNKICHAVILWSALFFF